MKKPWLVVAIVGSIGIMLGCVSGGFALGAPSRPLDAKFVEELTPNTEPNAYLFPCKNGTYLGGNPSKLEPRTGCIFQSSFGGWIKTNMPTYIGPRGGFMFKTSIQFLKVPEDAAVIGGYYSSTTGDYRLAKYTIADDNLSLYGVWDQVSGTTYQYSFKGPITEQSLTYAGSTKLVSVGETSIGFSPNGQWMAIKIYGTQGSGIAVVDTATFTPKVISWDPKFAMGSLMMGTFVRADTVSVSNDGRFVAATGSVSSKPQLRIYDTSTCDDQSSKFGVAVKNCTYADIWNGTYPAGLGATGSFAAAFPKAEYPRRVAFTSDGRIAFQSIHDRTASSFAVAQYSVANVMSEASVYVPEKLLALGDSYISGEGARSYRDGTDTANNKCHQSTMAYPYLLGEQYFGAGNYHSVACSGASTEDILNNTSDYLNQLSPHILALKYSDTQRSMFLNAYVPGYLNQLRFVSQDNPNVVLLSIGGNDVHFADIITLCVLSGANSPCFSDRGERQNLLNYIYTRHDDLVLTYKSIMKDAPNRRLYVVGYPQVMSTTGSCGLNVRFDASERQFGSMLIDHINATIKNAAQAAGAYYVDISHALDGHKLCEQTPNGMNGLTAGNDKFIIGDESYHPTALGHSLIAAVVDSKTDGLTAAMPPAIGVARLTVSQSDPFLSDLGPNAAPLRKLVFTTIIPIPQMIVTRTMRIKLDGTFARIPPNQHYDIEMHSEPVRLASGKTDANGNIDTTVEVPRLEYGAHTLHVYTTDETGTPLDLIQVVYVGVNETDYDGDGISNGTDDQPYVNDTGKVVGELPADTTEHPSDQEATASTATGSASNQSGQVVIPTSVTTGSALAANNSVNSAIALSAGEDTSTLINSVAATTSPGKVLAMKPNSQTDATVNSPVSPRKNRVLGWQYAVPMLAVLAVIVGWLIVRRRSDR